MATKIFFNSKIIEYGGSGMSWFRKVTLRSFDGRRGVFLVTYRGPLDRFPERYKDFPFSGEIVSISRLTRTGEIELSLRVKFDEPVFSRGFEKGSPHLIFRELETVVIKTVARINSLSGTDLASSWREEEAKFEKRWRTYLVAKSRYSDLNRGVESSQSPKKFQNSLGLSEEVRSVYLETRYLEIPSWDHDFSEWDEVGEREVWVLVVEVQPHDPREGRSICFPPRFKVEDEDYWAVDFISRPSQQELIEPKWNDQAFNF